MLHSVIIPHRNRNADLRHCLWALGQSVKAGGLGKDDVEVIVVDTRSKELPSISGCGCHAKLVFDPNTLKAVTIPLDTGLSTHQVYCKPAALNVGMDAAKGEVLTFLDADSIVGPRFLEAIPRALRVPHVTKLAYQVRRIDAEGLRRLNVGGSESLVETRKRWEHLDLATEIYVTPGNDIDTGNIECVPPGNYDPHRVIGNSQFTITRVKLGSRRWNQDYLGAGYEDLEMLRGIYRDHGGSYRAEILRHPSEAILMIPTPNNNEPDWRPPGLDMMNYGRYDST